MTRAETVRLLAFLAAVNPAMRVEEGTAEAWHLVLAQAPANPVMEAARRLVTTQRWVAVCDVVQACAASLGLLAPDEEQAYTAAVRVASDEGVGRSDLHPAVEEAYWSFGGAGGSLTSLSSAVRAQFRDAYRVIQRRHDETAMLGLTSGAIQSPQFAALG